MTDQNAVTTLAQLNITPETLIPVLGAYGLRMLGALLIFLIGRWLVKMGVSFARRLMRRAHVDDTLVVFGGNVIYAVGLTLVIVAAIGQMGVETTSIAAAIAAAGLAIGLALQGSLSNLAAGVMIIIFRPFKVGDYIEAAGVGGTVYDLSILTTRLRTPDNRIVVIPNNSVTAGAIINFTATGSRRLDLSFTIGYDDDLKKAKDILREILDSETRILPSPAPLIAVSELAENGVTLVARPWVKTSDYWSVRFDFLEAAKIAFDAQGISLALPQRKIQILEAKAIA